MKCSNCDQPIEAGAAFCGNCGHPILQTTQASSGLPEPVAQRAYSPIAQVYHNQSDAPPLNFAALTPAGMPSYAVPIAGQQTSEVQGAMSLVVSILGLVGALFIPFVGLVLGVAGIVLATLSRHYVKRGINLIGLILSCLAVLVGLAAWVYVASHDSHNDRKVAASSPALITSPAVSAPNLTTPCYSINFGNTLNIQNNTGSCNMNAFNGATLETSTNAYKVYGTVSTVSTTNFTSLAKQAIERDIQQSLPDFTITSEKSGQFAGSPAYFETASNNDGVSVIEALVLHSTSNGDNLFVFVHAVNAGTVNLNGLQAGWQWE